MLMYEVTSNIHLMNKFSGSFFSHRESSHRSKDMELFSYAGIKEVFIFLDENFLFLLPKLTKSMVFIAIIRQ